MPGFIAPLNGLRSYENVCRAIRLSEVCVKVERPVRAVSPRESLFTTDLKLLMIKETSDIGRAIE